MNNEQSDTQRGRFANVHQVPQHIACVGSKVYVDGELMGDLEDDEFYRAWVGEDEP